MPVSTPKVGPAYVRPAGGVNRESSAQSPVWMTSGTRDYSKYQICVFITQLHYELGVLGSDVKGLYENLGGILLLGGVPCGTTPLPITMLRSAAITF